jgi:transketolase
VAGRDASAKVLNAVAKNIPWLMGGSADLAPSTKTRLTFDGAGDFEAATPGGRNLHFGVREHAMGAIMSLRAIPGLVTLRPGDANEVADAWKMVLEFQHRPAALVLSRQAMPTFDRTKFAPAAGVRRGACLPADAPGGTPDVILIGPGSEVALCVSAHERLVKDGVRSRVVSMPSWDLFDEQPRDYRESVLPSSVTARVAVEQASALGWERYVGPTGRGIGTKTFGASAPLKDLQHKFGFEPDAIVAAARAQLKK